MILTQAPLTHRFYRTYSQADKRVRTGRAGRLPIWLRMLLGTVITLAVTPLYATDVAVPGKNDWMDRGRIIAHGNRGEWDWRLGGAISPSSMIRLGNKYILYYVGASGNRNDNGPAFRKLGAASCDVATDCTQAANWIKYVGNPIIAHEVPAGCEEAGIFSAAATVNGGTVFLYYGAMTGDSGPGCTSVSTAINLATSADGFSFTNDPGNPIISSSAPVYGAGDELWPNAVLFNPSGSIWYLYYGIGGSSQSWNIGVAWGSSPTNIGAGGRSKQFVDDTKQVFSFSVANTGDNYVSFRWQDEQVSSVCPNVPATPQWTVQVGDMMGTDLTTLTSTRGPNSNYPYDSFIVFMLGTIFFDSATSTWFLWHQDLCPLVSTWDSVEGKDVYLKTAGTGVRPNPPTNLLVK